MFLKSDNIISPKLTKYTFLTANQLKLIAITAMFIDHVASIFVPETTILYFIMRFLGRLTAPIMCYFVAEGYFYTSNIKKYITRLLGFAIISHIPYCLLFKHSFFETTSIMWPLLLGLISLIVYKKENINIVFKILITIICCVLAYPADWQMTPVLWILFFGIFRNNLPNKILSFLILTISLVVIPSLSISENPKYFVFGCFLFIPIMFLYNGKLGKKSNIIKWGFYSFYPLHMLILFLVQKLIF